MARKALRGLTPVRLPLRFGVLHAAPSVRKHGAGVPGNGRKFDFIVEDLSRLLS